MHNLTFGKTNSLTGKGYATVGLTAVLFAALGSIIWSMLVSWTKLLH